MKEHAYYKVGKSPLCASCGLPAGHSIHLLKLFEGTDVEREEARAKHEAETLTDIMRTPKADVSGKAGRMERESPLFFGTGSNPALF
jgi:hypothetical protein